MRLFKVRQRDIFSAVLALAMITGVAQGATLYKWVDADGNIVYQDTPPPGNVEFEESTVDNAAPALPDDTGLQIEEAALASPVTLYTVPDCDSCDLVRLYLERNSIPFAEKDIRNNQDTQGELQALVGSNSLSVPTLAVGEKLLAGYNKPEIKSALEAAGFPMERPVEASSAAESATVAGTSDAAAATESTAEVEPETGIAEISASGDEASSESSANTQ